MNHNLLVFESLPSDYLITPVFQPHVSPQTATLDLTLDVLGVACLRITYMAHVGGLGGARLSVQLTDVVNNIYTIISEEAGHSVEEKVRNLEYFSIKLFFFQLFVVYWWRMTVESR